MVVTCHNQFCNSSGDIATFSRPNTIFSLAILCNIFPIILTTIFQAFLCTSVWLNTSMRVTCRYLISIALFCNISQPNFEKKLHLQSVISISFHHICTQICAPFSNWCLTFLYLKRRPRYCDFSICLKFVIENLAMIAINLDGDRVKTYKVKVLATTFATLKILKNIFVFGK